MKEINISLMISGVFLSIFMFACEHENAEANHSVDMFEIDVDAYEPDVDIYDQDMINLKECGREGELISLTLENIDSLEGCELVLGDIGIGRASGSHLNDIILSVKIVKASIRLTRTINLRSMSFLHNLVEVNGDIEISLMENITDMSGLESLSKINGSFIVTDNFELKSLDGLENLLETGTFSLQRNPVLSDIQGLTGLERVNGDLNIESNSYLTQDQVDSLIERIYVDGDTNITF
jgi:hypothetical protein